MGWVEVGGLCRSETPLPLPATVTVRAELIDFGTVPVGEFREAEIEIDNPTPRDAEITFQRPLDGPFQVSSSRVLVPAGARHFEPVRFTPTQPGAAAATLSVDTCVVGCTETVELRGVGVGAERGVTCDPLAFGSVEVGECDTLPMTCTNYGSEPVAMSLVQMRDNEPSLGAYFAGGAPLPPGTSEPLVVVFCPSREGLATNEVMLFVDGQDEPVRAAVEGVGEDDAPEGCRVEPRPRRIQMGPLPVDEPAVTTLTLRNVGNEACQLQSDGLVGPSAPELRVISQGAERWLPAGQTADLEVHFVGGPEGTYAGRLRITDLAAMNEDIYVDVTVEVVDVGRGLTVTRTSAGLPRWPGGGTPVAWQGSADDGWTVVPIPFPFAIFGVTQAEVYVSTNGFITFSPDSAHTLGNTLLPSTPAPNALIAWWWDDLDPSQPMANVHTLVEGSPGQRRLRLRFFDIPIFGEQRAMRVTAEIWLLEGGTVEVYYGPLAEGSGRFSATVGWEGPFGQRGESALTCNANCTEADWPSGALLTYQTTP